MIFLDTYAIFVGAKSLLMGIEFVGASSRAPRRLFSVTPAATFAPETRLEQPIGEDSELSSPRTSTLQTQTLSGTAGDVRPKSRLRRPATWCRSARLAPDDAPSSVRITVLPEGGSSEWPSAAVYPQPPTASLPQVGRLLKKAGPNCKIGHRAGVCLITVKVK